MNPLEYLGWLGTTLLGIAAIPQVISVLKKGHADGMTWSYILILLSGFTCQLLYSIHRGIPVLAASYTVQVVLFSFIAFRKLYPRLP